MTRSTHPIRLSHHVERMRCIGLLALLSGCSFSAGLEAGPAVAGNDPQWHGGGEIETGIGLGWTPRGGHETLWIQSRVQGAALERYGLLSVGGGLRYSRRVPFGALYVEGGLDLAALHVTPTGLWGGAFGPYARVGVGLALARAGVDTTLETNLETIVARRELARSRAIETTLLTVSIGAEYDVLFETTHVAIFSARVGIAWWSENVAVDLLP